MKLIEKIPDSSDCISANSYEFIPPNESSVELISDNFWELNFSKGYNKYYISLTEIETENRIFNYRCDTFISGRYIQRLQLAIETFKKNKNKVIMSSWYPKLHARFLLPLSEYPYMETMLYTKGNGEFISFKIYNNKKCTPIVFITTIKNIENFIKR